MISPYTDKPDSSGSLLVNASTLSQITRDWAVEGYQVNIHAIGNLANRLAIDAFEGALKVICPTSNPKDCQAKHRFRIEHAQIIHPDDQKRMMDLGIIPSIQPTHATSDMVRTRRPPGDTHTDCTPGLRRKTTRLQPHEDRSLSHAFSLATPSGLGQ
jgi:predicted amidohydrolase YtcJ